MSEGQDKKLRELKAADEGGKKNKGGKAWKDIAEEMGFEAKDIGMLKTRWRELEAGAANGTGSGAVGKDDANEKGIASDQKKTKSGGSGVENNAKMPLLVPAIPTTGQIEVSPDDTFSVDDVSSEFLILLMLSSCQRFSPDQARCKCQKPDTKHSTVFILCAKVFDTNH